MALYPPKHSYSIISAGTLGNIIGNGNVALSSTAKYNDNYEISGRDMISYALPSNTVALGGEITIPSYNNPSDSSHYQPGGGGGGDTNSCCGDVVNINCPRYPGYDKPGGGGDTSYCGHGVPNINCPDYPGYDKPGGGGDTNYCGNGTPNINCPDYPGYDKPGGGGDTSYCGHGVPNINCPSYPGYDKPGGGGDTNYCGHGVLNINCPDYPGYDKPGGGGDTSYCGHGVPNINCPDYPGYDKPGGGGDTSYCGDSVVNINCPNYPGYDKPGGGGDTSYCGNGTPNINCPDYPGYDKPGGGGDTSYCGDSVVNINCPDYPGYDKPGGGGDTSYCGDSIVNINCPDYPGYDKPGGGGDTSYCGNGTPNINCPDYPGYDKPGGSGSGGDTSYCGGGIPNISCPSSPTYYLPGGGGDTSYCGGGVVNVNCPSYPHYNEPGGGGADNDGDGIPNINDPDAPNYNLPGGGGSVSSCRDDVVGVNCSRHPGYYRPGGGGADDDNDGMLNINDPDAPCYTLPGGGGDTNYCGGGVLNIFCPDYPEYISDDKVTLVDTIVRTYGDQPFNLSASVRWISHNPSVATVDPLDGTVRIVSAGFTYLLRLTPAGGQGGAAPRNKRLVVLPKRLIAIDTWVDTTKVFDGSRNADATMGSLVGVEPQDDGLVLAKVTAMYSDSAAGYGKPIAVSYSLLGSRAYCYVAPPSGTLIGSIVYADDSAAGHVFDALILVLKQVVKESGAFRYAPWAGVSVKYTVSRASGRQENGELKTNSGGKCVVSGLGWGDTVQVQAVPMRSYFTPPAQRKVVAKVVERIPALIYRLDSISMITLSLTDKAGNSLKHLEHEEIGDTIYYEVPCGRSDSLMEVHIRYTIPFGVSDNLVNTQYAGNVGGGGDALVTWADDDAHHLKVDMSRRGCRSTITLRLRSAAGKVKLYTFVLERKFGLFDVINEHIGHLCVVNNNPAANGHGLKFNTCEWYYKQGDGRGWRVSNSVRLYFTAGSSIHDKFTERDSMRVALTTVDGYRLETCPNANLAEYDAGSGSDIGGHSASIGLSVYPNPVPAGGLIRLKQVELLDDEDKLYTRLYLFDDQGHPVFTGSASELRFGLTMPEMPGVYHLVLEGKAGRKVLMVVVGQGK
jgi:hypothetical protein